MTRICLVAVALLVAACDDGNDVVIVDPVGDTIDFGVDRGIAIADLTAAELTGQEFLVVIGKTASILAELNDGEIAQASFAAQVVIADDVFDFANILILDFDTANVDLDAVVRFYGVGFAPSATADALRAEMNAGLRELQGTLPEDIDFAFVESQVINLAEAQVLLDELAFQVGAGVMGDYIANTQVLVADSLDQATAILDTFF